MTTLLSMRARRFRALRDVLTGATDPGLPRNLIVSDHLSRDIGIQKQRPPELNIGMLGTFPSVTLSR